MVFPLLPIAFSALSGAFATKVLFPSKKDVVEAPFIDARRTTSEIHSPYETYAPTTSTTQSAVYNIQPQYAKSIILGSAGAESIISKKDEAVARITPTTTLMPQITQADQIKPASNTNLYLITGAVILGGILLSKKRK